MQERVYDKTTEFMENNRVSFHLSLGRWITCWMCGVQQRGWLVFMWQFKIPTHTSFALRKSINGIDPAPVYGRRLFCRYCAPSMNQARWLQRGLLVSDDVANGADEWRRMREIGRAHAATSSPARPWVPRFKNCGWPHPNARCVPDLADYEKTEIVKRP